MHFRKPQQIRLLIADDHQIVRQGLRALLEKAGHIVVAEAANGREAVVAVNPDRRESNLEPLPEDIEQLWTGSSPANAPQTMGKAADETKYRSISLWWYVMLLVLAAAIAESVLASSYMSTQREEA